MVFFDILNRKFGMLKLVCRRKWMILNYEIPLLHLSKICDEEKERREKISGYEPKSYHSLLLNRHKVLEMDSNGFELQMIGSILKGAQIDTDIEEKIKNKRNRMDVGVRFIIFHFHINYSQKLVTLILSVVLRSCSRLML
jgi:hypothetical protein